MGRHIFWSNFEFMAIDIKTPKDFIVSGTKAQTDKLKDWLGIQYEGNIYYGNNHCPGQVLRNAVHPLIGKHIFDSLPPSLRNTGRKSEIGMPDDW